MAVNDTQSIAPTSIANGAFLTIQPASAEMWDVFNIYAGGACELYWYDGTNSLKFSASKDFDNFHYPSGLQLTNTKYLQVKNVSGVTANFAYSGAVRK